MNSLLLFFALAIQLIGSMRTCCPWHCLLHTYWRCVMFFFSFYCCPCWCLLHIFCPCNYLHNCWLSWLLLYCPLDVTVSLFFFHNHWVWYDSHCVSLFHYISYYCFEWNSQFQVNRYFRHWWRICLVMQFWYFIITSRNK